MRNFFIWIERVFSGLNKLLIILGSVSLLAAAVILSYSVIARGVFHLATEWQDEAAMFCLVGTTFLCAAYVQEKRGHIGISAIEGLLPHPVNKVRKFVIDVISFLFFLFFSFKTWDLLHDAWVDHQVSASTWGPPLWVPYSLMFLGMALLAIEILLQILAPKSIAITRSH